MSGPYLETIIDLATWKQDEIPRAWDLTFTDSNGPIDIPSGWTAKAWWRDPTQPASAAAEIPAQVNDVPDTVTVTRTGDIANAGPGVYLLDVHTGNGDDLATSTRIISQTFRILITPGVTQGATLA